MRPLIVHRSSFIVLLALLSAFSFPLSAFSQNQVNPLATQETVVPGTVSYFPDGSPAADSAWKTLTTASHAAQFFVLYVCLDSTDGYDTGDTVKIELLYNVVHDSAQYDSTMYLGYNAPSEWLNRLSSENIVGSIVFYEILGTVPGDTCWHVTVPAGLHRNRRYAVTVTDTVSLTLTEHQGR